MNTICACAGILSISFPWWVEASGRDILVHNALHCRGVLLQRGLTGIDILCGDALLSELNHPDGKGLGIEGRGNWSRDRIPEIHADGVQ
jgi:hypothetical protein